MKKNLFYIAALCAAAFVSCTPKELVIDEPNGGEEITDATALVHVTINASMDEATKAYIDDADGFAWKWAENDQLAVFDASNQKIVFTINSSTAGSSVAKFEADGVPSSFVPVKAVFPASAAGATPDEFNIKSAQSPSTYSIDPEAMVATADGEKVSDTEFNFYFEPAVSYFRFAVAAGVSKVILHTVGKDDTIAGDSRSVTVNLSGTEGKFWAAVNPAVYHGIRAFAYNGTSYAKKGADAAEIDLSAKGSGKNIGTVSGGTEVAVIENADALVSYLGGTPALDGYIVNDLDLTGKTVTTCASFAKTFDGQYHSIKNWTSNGVSMFASVTGSVKYLTIDKTCAFTALVSGNFAPVVCLLSGGSVVGITNQAPITANGTLTAQRSLAGIVARMEVATSTVEDCHNIGNISSIFSIGDTKATQYIGGVVGVFIAPSNNVRVKDCSNEGIITIEGSNETNENLRNVYIGGIVGTTGLKSGTQEAPTGYTSNYGTIQNCLNKGAVEVTWGGGTGGYCSVGGIVGFGECALDACVNEGKISLTNSSTSTNARPAIGGLAGGLAGTATVNAKDCINKGEVNLTGMFTNASASGAYGAGGGGTVYASCGGCFGLVGDNSTLVSNCDNYGSLFINTLTGSSASSTHTYGGIVGRCFAKIEDCDNLAKTFTVDDIVANCHIGGIVGYEQAEVLNCTLSTKIKASHDCSTLTGTNSEGKVIKNIAILNCGGIVGYLADGGGSISTCKNTADDIELTDVTSNIRFGGIVGMLYSGLKDCINSADLSVTRKFADNSMLNFCGGNAGYMYKADAIIEGCSNSGDISYTADKSSSRLDIGGNVGASAFACTVDSCINSGSVSVDGQGATCQALIGGVMGSTKVKNCLVKKCENTGNLSLTNHKSTSFSYLGGIWGHYTGADNKLQDSNSSCSITTDAASKVRVGGLAGGFYGSVSNCDAESTILVSNALAGSRVAGYIGYSSCSISGGSVSSSINASAAGASHAGLLFGDCARTYTLAGITVDGSLTTNSNFSSGLLFGGYNSASNGMVYTLGTETSPFIIKKSASVNNVSPINVPSTIGEVMGDTTTNAPASPSITFTNVVLAD